MANKEWRKSAGINDEYGLNIMNIATEPDRKSTKAEKGPIIARDDVTSLILDEGVSIKAFDSGKDRE